MKKQKQKQKRKRPEPLGGGAAFAAMINRKYDEDFQGHGATVTVKTPPAFKFYKPGEAEMQEASALVNGPRQSDYGTPRSNYLGIAKVWSGILSPILKRDITPAEAALMMAGLKLQRQAMKAKRDNLVDAHGYLLVYSHIVEEEAKP